MSQMVKPTAVFLLSSPTVQSLIDCGLYRICGEESITASSIRAAAALSKVIDKRKPTGLAAKLATEFFAVGAGRILLGASYADFERMANTALDRATEIESQLNGHDFDAEQGSQPQPNAGQEAGSTESALVKADQDDRESSEDARPKNAIVEPTSAEPPAGAASPVATSEDSVPGSKVEPTLAAGQTDVASQVDTTAAVAEAASQPEVAAKPDDVPVESLANHGIPAKVIEVLVAAGLSTAKAVRDRDATTQIDDLQDIGPQIRKKVLAAIDEAIA